MSQEPMKRAQFGAAAQQGVQAAAQRKKRLQVEEARYTLILHSARRQLGITTNEYCLADTIQKLSSTHSAVSGWCYASKETLAKSLDISRQSAHNLINTLREKGLVESQPETGYLRTTPLWYDTVEVMRAKHFK